MQISNNIVRNTAGGIATISGIYCDYGTTSIWNNIIYGFNTDSYSTGITIGGWNAATAHICLWIISILEQDKTRFVWLS